MEARVRRFQDLHANKWFHIMNWTLDVLLSRNKHEKYMLINYSSCFYF
jgi:hypothetical protein